MKTLRDPLDNQLGFQLRYKLSEIRIARLHFLVLNELKDKILTPLDEQLYTEPRRAAQSSLVISSTMPYNPKKGIQT